MKMEDSSDRANFVFCSCMITLLGKDIITAYSKDKEGVITISVLPGQRDSRMFRRCIAEQGTLPTPPTTLDYIDPHSLLRQ